MALIVDAVQEKRGLEAVLHSLGGMLKRRPVCYLSSLLDGAYPEIKPPKGRLISGTVLMKRLS